MAPRWRDVDKSRRRAIAAYISTHRGELIKEVPAAAMSDKNAKRGELLRLGRLRFSALPPEVQGRFIDMVEQESRSVGDTESQSPSPEGLVVDQPSAGSSNSPPSNSPPNQPSVGEANSLPNGQVHAEFRSCGLPDETRSSIMAELPFLQKKFPGPMVFDVIAASLRVLDELKGELQNESHNVKLALCLGVGAKLAAVGPSFTLDIWKHFAKAKLVPYMRSAELRLVAVWAKKGL